MLDKIGSDEEELKEALGDNYTLVMERLGDRCAEQSNDESSEESLADDGAPPAKRQKTS